MEPVDINPLTAEPVFVVLASIMTNVLTYTWKQTLDTLLIMKNHFPIRNSLKLVLYLIED